MKSICKLSKAQLAAELPRLAAEASRSQFVCKKCARVAINKKELCKPQRISEVVSADEEPGQ